MADNEFVRDIMTRDPQCVTANEMVGKVAKLMRDEDCGAIPVVAGESDKKIVGMITDRDIVVRVIAEGKNPSDVPVQVVMTKEIYSVKEDDSVESVFKVMSDRQVRRVPVVDKNNQLVGIVAQADIATESSDSQRVARTVQEISEDSKTR